MSLITVNRAILHSVWPNDLGRIGPQKKDLQVRESWRFVPEDFDSLYDWATVDDNEEETTDVRRIMRLVYDPSVLPEGEDGGPFVVTLILQGVLGKHELLPLGNWRGKETDAHQAMQYLTLHSGGHRAPFDAQRRVLNDLRELIQLNVGGDLRHADDDPDAIVLRRTVFTKVHGNDRQAPSIELDENNDPHKYARKIAAKWRVDHVIDTSVRRPNGANLRVAPDAMKVGDFVEVSVTANIRIMASRRRRQTVVEFCMHDVVRLWTAKEARIRLQRADPAHPAGGDTTRSAQIARIGSKQYGMPDEGDMAVDVAVA